jgi:hypothetical protein
VCWLLCFTFRSNPKKTFLFSLLFSDMNETKQNMAPQNSTLINLINDDDIRSIASERLSPIERDALEVSSGDEVC